MIMHLIHYCPFCWRITNETTCYECGRDGNDLKSVLDNKHAIRFMLWSMFPHYQVIENATLDFVEFNGHKLVFDFIVPECRLAIDVMNDLQILPPADSFFVSNGDRTLRIHFDDAKEHLTRQNNYRWITIPSDVSDARNKLINLNEIYIKHIDGSPPQVLTPRLPGDAGWDLVCSKDAVCVPGTNTDIPSDVYLEIPNHLYAIVQARSSTSKKGLLVLPGVIDAAYRGRIFTMTFNPTNTPVEVKKGDRISQLLFFYRVPHLHINPSHDLRPSERGERGFGSTDNMS